MKHNNFPYASRYAAKRPSTKEILRLGTFDASEPAFMSYKPGEEPAIRQVTRKEAVDLGKLIVKASSSC